MTSTHNVRELFGKTAYDVSGDKLGDVNEIFVDDNTGEPTFVEVNHGLFGLNSSLVPLRGHSFDGQDVALAFDKARIKDASEFDTDTALSVEEQAAIYRHFGIDAVDNRTAYTRDNTHRAPVDRDLGGPARFLLRAPRPGGLRPAQRSRCRRRYEPRR